MAEYILTGYFQDNNEQFNLKIDLPYNNGAYGLRVKKIKTPFELFCEKINQPDWLVKSMLNFVHDANYTSTGKYNKIQCINLARMLDNTLGLREAKELIDGLYP